MTSRHTIGWMTGLALLIAGLLWTDAASAFRCGNSLVREGDPKYQVLRLCGPPDHEEKQADAYLDGLGYVGVREVWYYDPGPNGFVRELTFRKGRLSNIEVVGRSGIATGNCDPHFIDEGLNRYQLLAECGEPAAKDSWYEHGRFKVGEHDVVSGRVKIEEWVYEFGPGQFIRYVRIIDGQVVKVELGERGSP